MENPNLFDFMRITSFTEEEVKQAISMCDTFDRALEDMREHLVAKQKSMKEFAETMQKISSLGKSVNIQAMGMGGAPGSIEQILEAMQEQIAAHQSEYEKKKGEIACLPSFRKKMMSIAEVLNVKLD